MMHIRAGYEIAFDWPRSTPMLLVVSVHPSRRTDLVRPQQIAFDRDVIPYDCVDGFGNVCTRIIAPAGRTTISTEFVIQDSGRADGIVPDARQHGVPRVDPMDFNAWFEVYLGGRWHTFDARNNQPRIGRILIARGRDATDVAISTSFGPTSLAGFAVFTDEVNPPRHS